MCSASDRCFASGRRERREGEESGRIIQEGRVQAHLNPWFSGHLISKRRQEIWSKDTAVYTVVPFSAGSSSSPSGPSSIMPFPPLP
ncbi:hypothetical protein E2C01_073058 [Portunus trituberculatus]|uniref:Uncharacterized protein n=1 Tax=Portunus trituberculatus TaxID=210409 RepID=A0A5B7I9K8_PORTR|nr:hypothetical protein [Portunus trituberculatus]